MKEITIIGNIRTTKELKEGKVSLNFAVNERNYQKNEVETSATEEWKTTWFNVIVSKEIAEYYSKGDMLFVQGDYSQSIYTHQGTTKINTTIFPTKISVVMRKKQTETSEDLPE